MYPSAAMLLLPLLSALALLLLVLRVVGLRAAMQAAKQQLQGSKNAS
jgi:hypothetical protein